MATSTLAVLAVAALAVAASAQTVQTVPSSIVYEWVTVEYDWTDAARAAAISSGAFIPENNIITGATTSALLAFSRLGANDTLDFHTHSL